MSIWKKKDKNDVRIFEGLKDNKGENILSNTGETIDIYSVWGNKTSDFEKKKEKGTVGSWKLKT